MVDRLGGIPIVCPCGEEVVMKTSATPRNPGCLFYVCPLGSSENWNHLFKWTDTCIVEEIRRFIEKVNNMEGSTLKLQKGLNFCDSVITSLSQETRDLDSVLREDIEDLRSQLRSMKMFLFYFCSLFYFLCFLIVLFPKLL
ncbi:putative transcription factor GRF family [Arabidopsis thaliana]